MKYFIRSVKYFIYITIIMAVVLSALVALGLIEGNISTMFRNGTDSLWQIALAFAAVSAIYPSVGFIRKTARTFGSLLDNKAQVRSIFEEKGYILEKEEDEMMYFRRRKIYQRLTRMTEDRITVSQDLHGIALEGLRRDVVPIALTIEERITEGNEN